jgi:signal transduction histidine kinase
MKRFSHPSIGEKNLLNLNEAVQTVITMARNEWKYVAEMHTELEADLPHVRCFVGDINQVLLNLTVNAAHAIDQQNNGSRKKGRIDIGTRSTPEHVEVFIRDTGCGIPEQHRGRIYDPFFTTKEVGKGTGQGLAISYAIMEKHNGSIDYTSKEGVGTVFTIRLPRN